MTEKFVNLGLLLSGYFHQDWDIEGTTDEEIVLAFRQAEPFESVVAAAYEVDLVLQLCAGDQLEADKILEGLGCEYNYQADGLTSTDWLSRVKSLLS